MGLEMIQNYFTPNKTVFYVDLPKEQTDLIWNKKENLQPKRIREKKLKINLKKKNFEKKIWKLVQEKKIREKKKLEN